MDNFSAHEMPAHRIKKLTFDGGFRGYQYDNVLVLFLPPNVTSVIQPLDQGIIVAFKAHYHKQHIAFVIQEVKNKVPVKDIKVNMLQVLQWSREARKFVHGETVANCWVKSTILPVLHENELKGEGERKTKVGAAKFKSAFEDLSEQLALLDMEDLPPVDTLIVGLEIEMVDDSGKGDDDEECESMVVDVHTEEEEDVDDELIQIPLTKAKEYAKALHHFVIDNLDQPQLFPFAHSSFQMAQAVNKMVDCSTKVQKEISSYFPVLMEENNDYESE